MDLEREVRHELDDASRAIDARLIQDSTPSAHAERREQGVLLADALARHPSNYSEKEEITAVASGTLDSAKYGMGKTKRHQAGLVAVTARTKLDILPV